MFFPPVFQRLIEELTQESARRKGERNPVTESKAVTVSGKQKRRRPGYVYLIRSVTGHYKIGRTRDPKKRMATFGVKLPFEVEFECLIKCEDMAQAEQELHAKFDHKRVNGEWFALSDEDVAYIKSLGGAA